MLNLYSRLLKIIKKDSSLNNIFLISPKIYIEIMALESMYQAGILRNNYGVKTLFDHQCFVLHDIDDLKYENFEDISLDIFHKIIECYTTTWHEHMLTEIQ